MPYNIKIINEQGQPLPGTVYFSNAAGAEIGLATVAPGGSDLEVWQVDEAAHFWITSPGYSPYGTSTLYQEGNTFTLFRSVPTFVYWGLGAVAALVVMKLLKFRL